MKTISVLLLVTCLALPMASQSWGACVCEHPPCLTLTVPNGFAGKAVTGKVGFADATDVVSFDLLLSFASGDILSSSAANFIKRNTLFFPSVANLFLGKEANFVMDPGAGKIRLVGLYPAPTAGPANIGSIKYAVKASAKPLQSQMVTLSGQAYKQKPDGSFERIQLVPCSVKFTVKALTALDDRSDASDEEL